MDRIIAQHYLLIYLPTRDYPRIQVFNIDDLLNGVDVNIPPTCGRIKGAQRAKQLQAAQA